MYIIFVIFSGYFFTLKLKYFFDRLMCCVIHIKRNNYVNLETYVMFKYGGVFTFYINKTYKIMTNLESLKSNILETPIVEVNS